MVDNHGGRGNRAVERLEHRIDRRVVGEREVNPVDAGDRIRRMVEEHGAVGNERARLVG